CQAASWVADHNSPRLNRHSHSQPSHFILKGSTDWDLTDSQISSSSSALSNARSLISGETKQFTDSSPAPDNSLSISDSRYTGDPFLIVSSPPLEDSMTSSEKYARCNHCLDYSQCEVRACGSATAART
ncbi:unnamed protein product, partial [Allacma fusca]